MKAFCLGIGEVLATISQPQPATERTLQLAGAECERAHVVPLPALTGVRFVAAICVAMYHFGGSTQLFWSRGFLGVSLFYVLSGFILTYAYWGRLGTSSLRDFYRARVARIYPVYVLALVVALPRFAYALITGKSESAAALVLAPLALQSWVPSAALAWNAPGWSISNELAFYLAFPLCLGLSLKLGSVRASLFALASVVAAIGVAWLVFVLNPDGLPSYSPESSGRWLNVVKFNPVMHLPEFFVGVASACLYMDRRWRHLFVRLARFDWLVACGTVVLVVVVSAPYPVLHTGLFAIGFALLVLALAGGTGPLARLLSGSHVAKLGEASFALYLVHGEVWGYAGIISRRVGWLNMEGVATRWMLLGASIVIALFVFHIVEEPARAWIRGNRARTTHPG